MCVAYNYKGAIINGNVDIPFVNVFIDYFNVIVL